MAKKPVFPANCCGVCFYFHTQKEDKDSGLCFALPPQFLNDEDGTFSWRGTNVEPVEPACIHFKPRHHA